jgi:DNA segregation ATPase FtsK/SpoIIIE-like protein
VRSNSNLSAERKSELIGIGLGGLTIILFLTLVTDGYDVNVQATRPYDKMYAIPNLLSAPGALLAGILAELVGDARHVTYSLTFVWALMLISHRPMDRMLPRMAGAGVLLVASAAFLQLNVDIGQSNAEAGGVIGQFTVYLLSRNEFGIVGANVVLGAMMLVGLMLAAEYLFVYLYFVARHGGTRIYQQVTDLASRRAETARATRQGRATASPHQDDLPLEGDGPPLPLVEALPPVEVAQQAERLASITIHGAGADLEGDEGVAELPFDAVPDIYEDDAGEEELGYAVDLDIPETAASAGPEEAEDVPVPDSMFDDAYEKSPFEMEEALEGVAVSPDNVDDQLPLSLDEFAAEDESPPAPAKPKPRRPRRKVVEHEEIPHDYKYPKVYKKPSISILDEVEARVAVDLTEELRGTSLLLEETLRTFGIEARVTDVTRGPTITRYELEPAPGIKVARFQALADDIALALKAHRIRVEAPIPGKGRVGIEAPNVERDPVLIRELIESRPFKRGKGKLNLVLGKDIAGDVKIADLATMPHLLVAGATGAGKTVCVKALLASLLFQNTPDDLQLILIDPKMVELSIFNDIPHLITPVVIDPKKASVSLTWLINEMEERYRLFADLRVRNIEVYNQSVENGEIEMEGDDEEATQSVSIVRRLPYIVCVIDELADLMMLARSEVEDSIGRLAQLARAVGIHMIIATQRPSVDVLTGVIKANFPSRISFQVSSRVDSRCILDEIGAERLIGMGDMLYLPAGQSKPNRIQGAFVSDEEMNSLIMHLKRQAPPQYKDEIENWGKSKDKLEEIADEADELFEDAVTVVMETGQASISMVQRRLRVGYTRAARLVDMMERKGIVGPHTGSKAREILVDTVQAEESS